jgi:hypothetical protein
MGLSGLEDFMVKYFQGKRVNGIAPAYTILLHVKLKPQRSSLPAENWTDIYILALGREEIYIVKTQDSFRSKDLTSPSMGQIREYFSNAKAFVEKEYDVRGKKVKKLFVKEDFSFMFF